MGILFLPQPAAIHKGPIVETVPLPPSWSAHVRISGSYVGNGDILTVGANSSGGGGIQLHVHNGALRLLHSSVQELHNFGSLGSGISSHEISLYWRPDSWTVDLDGVKTSEGHEVEPVGENLFLGKANGFDPDFSIDFSILVENV